MPCLRFCAPFALVAGLVCPPLLADSDSRDTDTVRGTVETRNGLAIERAKVSRVDGDSTSDSTFTDTSGAFALECPDPCLLLVTHPRFEDTALEIREPGTQQIILSAKQEIFEQIDVTASRGEGDSFVALSVASTEVRPQESAAAPTTLTELVEGVAGVAENGQGGLFQVYSIRGVSRHRVLTLIAGMPVTSERRAGVSASFLDPLLMGSVDVLRGPSSTYYGSGALGGVVQIFPRAYDGWAFDAGYAGFGDERHVAVGWGASEDGGGWNFGLARRETDDDEAADGTALNNGYTQTSAVFSRDWTVGDRSWQVLAIPTYGEDIGKPNTDFPERVTDYPRERHLLLRLTTESSNGGTFQLYAHPNDLQTDVVDVSSDGTAEGLSTVLNESLEYGASWQREWSLGNSGRVLRLGLDFNARDSVNADEREEDLVTGEVTEARTLANASQNEAAVFSALRWHWGASTWQAGTRFTWHRQGNDGFSSRDDSAWTAFAGVVRPLGKGFEWTANLGTGLRFPTLSERFFTGTTGRGQVIGNQDLEPEESINADTGLRWYGQKAFWGVQVFRQDVDDYIERINLADGRRTFVNLSSGTIDGFEVEGFYQASPAWRLHWSGHRIEGDDDAGVPLADIPADQLAGGATWTQGPWRSRVELQYRFDKDDPGSGEIPIDEAWLLSASLRYRLTSGLELVLRGRNLLDEEYRNSADDRVTLAPGRALGLSLAWGG